MKQEAPGVQTTPVAQNTVSGEAAGGAAAEMTPPSGKDMREALQTLQAQLDAQERKVSSLLQFAAAPRHERSRDAQHATEDDHGAAGDADRGLAAQSALLVRVSAERDALKAKLEVVTAERDEARLKLAYAEGAAAERARERSSGESGSVSRAGTPPARPRESSRLSSDGSDSDESEVSHLSYTTSVAAVVAKIKPITAAEAQAHALSMRRADLSTKIESVVDFLENHHELYEQLIELRTGGWRAAVAADAHLSAADRKMHTALSTLVQLGGDCDEKALFLAHERALRKANKAEAKSGRALLERIQARGRLTDPSEVRDFRASLAGKYMMREGVSKETNLRLANDLREAWERVPRAQRGGVCMRRELLARVPQSVSGTFDRTFAEVLEDELAEQEAPDSRTAVWTYDQLASKIARRLQLPRGPGGREVTAAATAEEGTAAAAAARTAGGGARRFQCFNCGLHECEGHKECEVRGPCGYKFCPCCHGGACVMVMDTMPPNEGTMAGDGKPVIERTYKRLAAYHGAAANVAKRAEAAAAEAAGGAAGGGGTAAPLVVGKGGLGARRVVGATLDARAPRFVQLDDMHPVERAYASWAVLEDDDAFMVGGSKM